MKREQQRTGQQDKRGDGGRASGETRDLFTIGADDLLAETLGEIGLEVVAADDDAVTVTGARAPWLRDGLRGLGFEVGGASPRKKRAPKSAPPGGDGVAIPRPADADRDAMLVSIRAVMKPAAVLMDVDGVLVDVSRSYRRAVMDTAAYFGATVTTEGVAALRARGNANDDHSLTLKILEDQAIKVKAKEVTTEFERRYQGGLWRHETLRFKPEALRSMADRYPLALVTTRPRKDLYRLLEYHGLLPLFQAVVVKEDGPPKPDPWGVKEALIRLDVKTAWMLGDTVDDIVAARGAGVVPIGVTAVGEGDAEVAALRDAGAARVLGEPAELVTLLP